jgi:hypothetical protein
MRFLASPAQLLVFAALFHLASTLGINCRGAAYCVGGQAGSRHSRVASRLTSAIENIDGDRWYADGELVACVTNQPNHEGPVSFCAFLQSTGGALGSRILELAHYIEAHGCRGCGSVPVFYPEQNEVSGGELTYNYVRRPCLARDGLCSVSTANTALSGFKICTCTSLSRRIPYLIDYSPARLSFSVVSIFTLLQLYCQGWI